MGVIHSTCSSQGFVIFVLLSLYSSPEFLTGFITLWVSTICSFTIRFILNPCPHSFCSLCIHVRIFHGIWFRRCSYMSQESMKVGSARTVVFSTDVRVFPVEYDVDRIGIFRPGLQPLSLEFKIPKRNKEDTKLFRIHITPATLYRYVSY